jgi:hypothetical protein
VLASALRNFKASPLTSATAVAAMDRGQFANVPLEVREWFEHLRSPTGVSCCSYADGRRTRYDMRQGQYWVPIRYSGAQCNFQGGNNVKASLGVCFALSRNYVSSCRGTAIMPKKMLSSVL